MMGVLLLIGCGKEEKETVLIGAASSLTNPLDEIGALYREEHPDVEIVFTYGGSGTIAKQIEEGAEIDLFLPADVFYLEQLESIGAIEKDSDILLANELVLVANKNSSIEGITFQDLSSGSEWKIAIGDPATVPVGKYALEALGPEFDLEESQVNLGSDVRQVLTWVEQEAVDLGIIYISDALSSDKVNILDYADETSHSPIEYPLALVSESEETTEFADYLYSKEAISVFEEYGFKRSE